MDPALKPRINAEYQLALAGGLQKMVSPDVLLRDLGDLHYRVTVDKKTATITRVDVDFSGLMATISRDIAEIQKFPDNEKEKLNRCFSSMKNTISVTYSQINTENSIAIPEEVKSQSEEVANVGFLENGDTDATIVKQSFPEYPTQARLKGLEGEVVLRITISDKGTVISTDILRSSGYRILDNAAVDCVKKWIWTPAKDKDNIFFRSAIVPIRFKLK